MRPVNYISNLNPAERSGGWGGVNSSLYAELAKYFQMNFVGPISPRSDYAAKVVSKVRRTSGLAGSYHFFSQRRLQTISRLIGSQVKTNSQLDFFHGSTPWILYDSPRPYFAYVDTCFSTYINVYHDSTLFIGSDLNRIFDTEARWLSRAAGIFFGTEWAKEQVVNDYSLSSTNLHVVGAGGNIDIPERDQFNQGRNLLFIAYDFERKGGNVAVEAFRKTKAQYHDAELTIVGDRPSDEVLRLDGVSYEGFLRKSVPAELGRLKHLYATAFALIHPTSSDIQPLVISEAGYFGCPAIAPRSFGIPDLIKHGATGFLIDLPLTGGAFAERILELCADPVKYAEMRKATREHALENQNWPAVGERIVQIMKGS
jgi:glycosyltransferase involved in cell wall biosynthesis